MERGPRYDVYAQLRESNLQSKRLKVDEVEQVLEMPKSEHSSTVKKSVNFEGDLGEFEDAFRVSALPRPGFLKKSVKFHWVSDILEENMQVCEIPKSEYSPILKKSVKFHQNLGNFEEDEQLSSMSRPNFLRNSVSFHGISSIKEESTHICEIPRSEYSPILKKSVKFQGKTERKQGNSVLGQSVPDFSSVLRKENQKPIPKNENICKAPRLLKSATPPTLKATRDRMYGSGSKLGEGNKCVNSGEKESNARYIFGRKSYANFEGLKGLSVGVAKAINGESRGGRKSGVFNTKYY